MILQTRVCCTGVTLQSNIRLVGKRDENDYYLCKHYATLQFRCVKVELFIAVGILQTRMHQRPSLPSGGKKKKRKTLGEEVCLRNVRGTRGIKVHGNGRNNQFSINGGNAEISSSEYRVAKENPWRDSDALFVAQKERENCAMKREPAPVRDGHGKKPSASRWAVEGNNLERSLPYLNFYATSYSTDNSCHVYPPTATYDPRACVTFAQMSQSDEQRRFKAICDGTQAEKPTHVSRASRNSSPPNDKFSLLRKLITPNIG